MYINAAQRSAFDASLLNIMLTKAEALWVYRKKNISINVREIGLYLAYDCFDPVL